MSQNALHKGRVSVFPHLTVASLCFLRAAGDMNSNGDALETSLLPFPLKLLEQCVAQFGPSSRILLLSLLVRYVPGPLERMIASVGLQVAFFASLCCRNEEGVVFLVLLWLFAVISVFTQDVRDLIYRQVITFYTLLGSHRTFDDVERVTWIGDLRKKEIKFGGFKRTVKLVAAQAYNAGFCIGNGVRGLGSQSLCNFPSSERSSYDSCQSVEEIWAERSGVSGI